MTRGSLRWQIVVGAVLWTLGLFAFFGVVITYLLQAQPHAIVILHRPLSHIGFAVVLAVVLLIGGLMQVRRGVSPISQLRHKLSGVHAGHASRVEGEFPSEVAPLVTDLNALLDHHEAAVAKAQTKAGDLAHGLKTPLAVLSREATAAEEAGLHPLADSIRQQVARMQRQIDYHLAHARAAASGSMSHTRTGLDDAVSGLVRTVQRIYADRTLDISAAVPESLDVKVQREDLEEMIGNLLDNACKWAKGRVLVGAVSRTGLVDVIVDDDGPGVPAGQREDVLRRGVRADEAAPGSGFGLAIVADLVEAYGGAIRLEESPLGGARAVLTLPTASVSPPATPASD